MTDEAAGREGGDVPWLDPEQLRAWMCLVGMVEGLQGALDAQLKRDAGVNRFEYMVLVGLSDSPDRTMAMSKLALFATGSLSRLSHAVNRLAAQGWVERQATGTGRQIDIRLTDDGAARLEEIAPGHVREARRLVVDVLDRRQLVELGRSARAILGAVNPAFAAALDEVSEELAARAAQG